MLELRQGVALQALLRTIARHLKFHAGGGLTFVQSPPYGWRFGITGTSVLLAGLADVHWRILVEGIGDDAATPCVRRRRAGQGTAGRSGGQVRETSRTALFVVVRIEVIVVELRPIVPSGRHPHRQVSNGRVPIRAFLRRQ